MKINRKVSVHGVQFANIALANSLALGSVVTLKREPENKVDANAVMVLATKKGWFKDKLVKVGYVDAKHAPLVAKIMDAGVEVTATVEYYKKYQSYPVIDIRIVGSNET